MKRFLISLTVVLAVIPALRAMTYDELTVKADRFYRYGEWPSALAMMQLMLDERPDDVAVRARAITAAAIMNDHVTQLSLTRGAINRHIPFDSLFSCVETAMLAQTQAPMYTSYLERVAEAEPWLARSIDAYLLRFYSFRRNPQGMITYSRKMLAGMPGNIKFLHILAEGQILDNQMDEAVATLKQILQLDPDDNDALLTLGNYYLITGNRDEAEPLLRHACTLRPTPYLRSLLDSLDEDAR